MALPLVERILGTSNPYVDKYHAETSNLAKSMTFLCHEEAETYNERIRYYGLGQINEFDKTTWRYYLHVTGNYHELDEMMYVVSRDTREVIELTKENLEMHFETRLELAKFGSFYDEVYEKYPFQNLLIKALVGFSPLYKVEDVIKLPNWTLTTWNARLVEAQETDLIGRLQQRVYNYAVSNMLTTYHYVDDLYLALLVSKLKVFVLKSLTSIRKSNARTARVHSYHMLMYFASNHNLDDHYRYLDDYQRLFLYRNLLYLNTHAGRNETFETIVEVFFTYKRIVLTNYVFQQDNVTKDDLSMDYSFRQELLNSKPFVYDSGLFKMDALKWKEIKIKKGNSKEYDFHERDIDIKLEDSLVSEIMTKDLEVNFNDSSSDVRYSLLEATLDYWAATIHKGRNHVLVEFINSTDGTSHELTPLEAFKLFILAFHTAHGTYPVVIPNYHTAWVIKENIPTLEFLMRGCGFDNNRTRNAIEEFRPRAPKYESLDTRRDFRDLVLSFYRYELGVDIIMASQGNLDVYTDITHAFDKLHECIVLDLGQENSGRFLGEIGLPNLFTYTREQALDLVDSIINSITDDLLSNGESNRLSQNTAIAIFNKFTSYTTQTLSEYFSEEIRPAGLGTPRYSFYSYETETAWPLLEENRILDVGVGTTTYNKKLVEIDNSLTPYIGVSMKSDLVKEDYQIKLDKSSEVFTGFNIDLCIDVERVTPFIMPSNEKLKQIFNIKREVLVSHEY